MNVVFITTGCTNLATAPNLFEAGKVICWVHLDILQIRWRKIWLAFYRNHLLCSDSTPLPVPALQEGVGRGFVPNSYQRTKNIYIYFFGKKCNLSVEGFKSRLIRLLKQEPHTETCPCHLSLTQHKPWRKEHFFFHFWIYQMLKSDQNAILMYHHVILLLNDLLVYIPLTTSSLWQ